MTDEISLYYHTSFNFKETDGTIHFHDAKGMYSQSVCLTGLAIERPITYNNSLWFYQCRKITIVLTKQISNLIVLSVLLRSTASEYSYDSFKLFLYLRCITFSF